MKWRPTRRQFYTLGLPASVCTPAARVIASVDPSTDTFVLPGHGFEAGDLVRFEPAAEDAVLPAPLSGSLLYEVYGPPGSDLFQVRAVGGALINITNEGTGLFRVIEDFGPRLDVILQAMARWCDGHATPYTPPSKEQAGWPPDELIMCACELAALKVAMVLRVSSPAYSLEVIKSQADKAQTFLDKMAAGRPSAVTPMDATPDRPELGARAFARRVSRGWGTDAV